MTDQQFQSEEARSQARQLHLESRLLCDTDPARSLEKAEITLAIALQHHLTEEEILAKENIAYQVWHGGDIHKALTLLEETQTQRINTGYLEFYDWCIKSISMIHWGQGNFDLAFQTIYDALPLLDENSEEKDKCLCYWALGVFYFDLKDIDRSLEYYRKSLALSREDHLLDNNITAYNLIGLGCCSKEFGDLDGAKSYFEDAQKKSSEYQQWMQRSRCLYEIGLIYQSEKSYELASLHLSESLLLRREHKAIPGMISCLIALTDIEKEQGNFSKAVEYVNEALIHSEKLGSKTKLFQCYERLSALYKTLQDYEKAYFFLEKFHQVRSEVYGERTNNRIKELESNFVKLKSEKEAEIQRLINVELKEANEVIKTKNDEILASVNYARLIQQAILPSDELLHRFFPEHFLLYLPKDIVAGDFYWIEQAGNKLLFAVADCTGHGVPGAMMSVMCSNALSRAVKEFELISPAHILDSTASILAENFSKNGNTLRDGMDIGLCSLDLNSGALTFAGANRLLYVIKGYEPLIIQGNKQPVGDFEDIQPFLESNIQLEKGDMLFLYSDGYGDQFGGPNSKKYKSPLLKEFLFRNHEKPIVEQREELFREFQSWKGANEQTDDVCILGIRF